MSEHRSRLLLLIVIIPLHWGQAQEPPRDLPAGPPAKDTLRAMDGGSVLFDRNLNTYNWLGRVELDTMVGWTHLGLFGNHFSNIIIVDDPTRSQRLRSTQEGLTLKVDQYLIPSAGISAKVSSFTYKDNKGVGLSSASNRTVLGGAVVHPWPFLSLMPLAGYRWETQGDIADQGLSLDISADLGQVDLDGYRMYGKGVYHRDNLDPRVLENHEARATVQKWFTPFTRDSLDLTYYRQRREFYALADSTIESRKDNVFSISNLLEYGLTGTLNATVFVSVMGRTLNRDILPYQQTTQASTTFDTQIDEFRLDSYAQTTYRSDDQSTSAWLRFAYTERNEAHRAILPADASSSTEILWEERNRQEQSKDNLTRRVGLSGFVSLPLWGADRISLAGTVNILRYDTPSQQNLEDRDELLTAVTLGTYHAVSPTLDVGVTLDGAVSHLVYLLKERSANNNRNYVLRLLPHASLRPAPWLRSTNGFEVLANYTVYDYEQQVALVRSFSYRQFALVDSTQIDVTGRLGVDLHVYLKLYERGTLRWDEFVERTENSVVDRTFAGQVRFTPTSGLFVAVGWRYYSQSRYVFDQVGKRLETFFSSTGPTCVVRWAVGPHSQISMNGWYERRKQGETGEEIRYLPGMTLSLQLYL